MAAVFTGVCVLILCSAVILLRFLLGDAAALSVATCCFGDSDGLAAAFGRVFSLLPPSCAAAAAACAGAALAVAATVCRRASIADRFMLLTVRRRA